jgi:hypothetical protein
MPFLDDLQHLLGTQWRAAPGRWIIILAAISTGLRRSELVALR